MTTNINLPQGYKLIANYNDEIVLAQSLNEENPEPYVTWMVHDSGVHTGCYFAELSQAQLSFAERAFGISEIIAEPIFRYGATKEDVKSAQQKFRLCEPTRNGDTDSSCKVNIKRNYGDLTPRTAREKMLVKKSHSLNTESLSIAIAQTLQIFFSTQIAKTLAKLDNNDFSEWLLFNSPFIIESIVGRYRRQLNEIV